jgi:predicted PhzF superfamily epimerase YddE/YHI9
MSAMNNNNTTNSANVSETDGSNACEDETIAVRASPPNLRYRRVGPTDILKCAKIGTPRRTKRDLQYWQHHASPYFICAVLHGDNENDENAAAADVGDADDNSGNSHNNENTISGQQVQNDDSTTTTTIKNNHDHDHHDDDHGHDEDDVILGYISGIRLEDDKSYGPNDEMLVERTPHRPNGKILAIRAFIVRNDDDEYDNEDGFRGGAGGGGESNDGDDNIAQQIKKATRNLRQAMLERYISKMKHLNRPASESEEGSGRQQHGDGRPPMEKLVAVCRSSELPMYLECGFAAIRLLRAPKGPVHAVPITDKDSGNDASSMAGGPERWYYLELSLLPATEEKEESIRYSLTDQSFSLSPECYIVDSFTDRPGAGNPAAVVLLPEDFDPDKKQKIKWMQTVAAEFNLAETAFCWPQKKTTNGASDDKKGLHWNIRYYTPIVEMPLCGHATLASAAVLYQSLSPSPSGVIVFHAREEVLTMRLANSNEDDDADCITDRISRISMDFPPKPANELTTRDDRSAIRNMLSNAFGDIDLESSMLFIGSSDLGDLLIELQPQAFADIGYDSLNFKAFLEWDGYYRGVIICCMASEENNDVMPDGADDEREEVQVDFLSRFFAPKAGINEDDVTGSAHCILGPYFAKKLKKDVVVGRQVSKRSGIIECRVSAECVTLTGSAVVTMNGRLHM